VGGSSLAGATCVCLIDADLDSDLDLAIGGLSPPSRIFRNEGAWVFSSWPSARDPADAPGPAVIAAGDLDRDGAAELLVGGRWLPPVLARDHLYHNDRSGSFTDAQRPHLGVPLGGHSSAAIGDLDGDGAVDLILTPSMQVFRNDGIGGLAALPGGAPPITPTALALGDLDGDGDLDVVAGGNEPERRYRNDGIGRLSVGSNLPATSGGIVRIVVVDVDRDGDPDVLLAKFSVADRLLLNDGSGGFADVTSTHLPVSTASTDDAAFGDVDVDGDLDLLLVGATQPLLPAEPRLLANDGTGRFGELTGTHLPPPSATRSRPSWRTSTAMATSTCTWRRPASTRSCATTAPAALPRRCRHCCRSTTGATRLRRSGTWTATAIRTCWSPTPAERGSTSTTAAARSPRNRRRCRRG
jgi:hypothetical protein